VLFKRAQMNGLLPKKNELTARYTFGGQYKILKSNLDFTIINQDGVVGFFDAKSYENDHFTYSDIDQQQIQRAAEYNQWKVPSGFIVLFRSVNKICFFSGWELKFAGPRTRFDQTMGIYLGRLENFNMKLLFKKDLDI